MSSQKGREGQGRLFEEEVVSSDLRQFDTLKGGVRLVATEGLLPDPLTPCVVNVRHYTQGSVEEKMVGKVIHHPGHGLVFLHCHSGTQYHAKHDCPSPVDSALVAALMARGVHFFYAYDRKRHKLWRAEVGLIAEAPEEWFDNRRRRYLAADFWRAAAPVSEVRQGPNRVYCTRDGAVLLNAPHLETIIPLAEGGF